MGTRKYLVYQPWDMTAPWSRHRTLSAARREAQRLSGGARIWFEYTNRREVRVVPKKRERV